jgi:biotin transport system ATP-binding protein
VIDVAGVTHVYDAQGRARTVLHDVTARLTERRIGIIGANGSGKSTFVRLLNGLVLPTHGSVSVNGLDTRSDGRGVRRLVGFCFTNPDAQIVMPTVSEDVAFGLRRSGLSKAEIADRVDQVLGRFGLADHADHPAHLLSGGQKQLLALASVLVTEPAILVLDEPTTLLDLRNTHRVTEHVAALDQQVVLVTHDLEQLTDFDRVLVFDEARLVHDGLPTDAVEHYRKLMR